MGRDIRLPPQTFARSRRGQSPGCGRRERQSRIPPRIFSHSLEPSGAFPARMKTGPTAGGSQKERPARPALVHHHATWWLIGGFLAGVFSLAGDQTSPPEIAALAAEVRDRGWLVFGARLPAGDWDLFRCRPDGSAVAPLTSTPVWSEFAPQFSRDGTRLLYRRVARSESLDGNRYGEQGELILALADGSNPTVLGRAGDLPWASFGPDGRQIVSLSIKGISFHNLTDGTLIRSLPRNGFFQQVSWSPDGRWLVGVANSFGTGWSVARMDATSGGTRAINTVDCCTPDWFPDSRQVVFSWRPPGQKGNRGHGWTQLWRADAEGKSRQLIYAEEGRHVYGGHISPDGKYVLFTGNLAEDGDPGNAGAPMGLMRLADAPIIGGGSAELRSRHPEAKRGPVLVLPVGWEPCWMLSDLAGGTVSTPGSVGEPASELRQSGWLVFSARGPAGDWDLFAMRPDGSDRRRITDTRDFHEAGARFSPDGSRLLFYRVPASEAVDNNTYGTFDLVIAEADGSSPVVWGRDFPWATWGPDSSQFACLTPRGIRIVDIITREVVRELPRRGLVSQLVWSPDGTRFVGTANGLGPFWNIGCLDAETAGIHAVSETDRYNCTPDWSPDGRSILYARGIIPAQPGRAELWVANADGSSRRRIYAEEGRHIYGACMSPDGRHVVFTRSVEDLGPVPAIEMAIIRWPPGDAAASSPRPRFDLGPGWEPHWSATARLK